MGHKSLFNLNHMAKLVYSCILHLLQKMQLQMGFTIFLFCCCCFGFFFYILLMVIDINMSFLLELLFFLCDSLSVVIFYLLCYAHGLV